MRIMRREEEITSNYMEICLYNKTKEIENKIAEGKAPETDRIRYENIFRTEVKVKNLKLNANKDKGKVPDKSLETYYNDEATTKLYNTPTKKLFGENDFYRIDVAVEIINNKDNIKPKTKGKLIDLLLCINAEGYTFAKQYWVKKYSEQTFRNHIKKIEELGINILTFDTKIDYIEIETEKVKNFSNLKNNRTNNSGGNSNGDN